VISYLVEIPQLIRLRNRPGMDNDEFNALMRLAEFRNSRIADRRSHEWKVTLALWALLAAGMLQLKIPHHGVPRVLLVLGLLVIVTGHALFWVMNHWAASRRDIQTSFFYTDRAHDLALPAEKLPSLQPWPRDLTWREIWQASWREPRCWAQIGTTIVLTVGLALLVWKRAYP
jgi:hypothetical protein